MRKIEPLSLFVSTLLFILAAVSSYADETRKELNGSDLQEFLDKAELSVEYFEANGADLLGDREKAKTHREKIISYYGRILDDPRSTYNQRLEAVREMGSLSIQCGNYDEAVALYKNALAEFPDNRAVSNELAEALYAQAMGYAVSGQADKAVANCLFILDMDDIHPNWQPFIKHYLGNIYLAEGRYEDALSWYEEIASEHQDLKNWPACAYYSIAELYIIRGEYTKAKEYLQTILNQYPLSSWSRLAQDKIKEMS